VRLRSAAAVAAVALLPLLAGGCSKGSGHAATTTTSRSGPRAVVLLLRPLAKTNPNDCGAFPANPPADKPVAGLYSNECIELEPGGFPVSRADLEQRRSASGLDVRVTLLGADVQAFAAFTRAQQGGQVAVVGLGKVLALVAFKDPVTDGQFIMSGLNQGDTILIRNQLR